MIEAQTSWGSRRNGRSNFGVGYDDEHNSASDTLNCVRDEGTTTAVSPNLRSFQAAIQLNQGPCVLNPRLQLFHQNILFNTLPNSLLLSAVLELVVGLLRFLGGAPSSPSFRPRIFVLGFSTNSSPFSFFFSARLSNTRASSTFFRYSRCSVLDCCSSTRNLDV